MINIKEDNYNKNKTVYENLWKNNCPFCDYKNPEQKKLILWKWKYWYIIYAKFPYTNTNKHIMAIPYKHRKKSEDILKEEFLELYNVHKFIKKYFWKKEYFSFTRETFWNRSLEHYHMHFLNWKLQWRFLREMLKWQWLY